MVRVVTAEQMREYDRHAIEQAGFPGVVLMENAGAALVAAMAHACGPLAGKRVALFCGGGNNGGDGFVAARRLALLGAHPTVYFLGKEEGLKSDAATHLKLLSLLQVPLVKIGNSTDFSQVQPADIVVDALLGTGSKGEPREPIRSAISLINRLPCPIFSIDIPSGIDSDTGAVATEAVRATYTVTLGCPKIGLFLFPAASYVGTLLIDPIGFDWDRIDLPYVGQLFSFSSPIVRELLGPRHPNANKGDFGHVAVLAGSKGMVGAPAMVAKAAQRSGAGLVTVLAPKTIQPLLATKLDEQMTLPLPDKDGALAEEAFDEIMHFSQKATLFCIGPGLTTQPHTVALVHKLLEALPLPIVLDADGLNALAQKPECAQHRTHPLVLTPHPGEAARLMGTSPSDIESDRVGAVKALAERYQAVVLLKGRYTLVGTPEGQLLVNTTGNPGMATGGSGDTLTGILGGLLAQALARGRAKADRKEGYKLASLLKEQTAFAEVVALGAHLHGLAGDIASQVVGETALTASDILAYLPKAIQHSLSDGDALPSMVQEEPI